MTFTRASRSRVRQKFRNGYETGYEIEELVSEPNNRNSFRGLFLFYDLADSAGIRLGQLRCASRQRRGQTEHGQAAEPTSRQN
jgi:hypothetical protein